jgi:hypothetical protein
MGSESKPVKPAEGAGTRRLPGTPRPKKASGEKVTANA